MSNRNRGGPGGINNSLSHKHTGSLVASHQDVAEKIGVRSRGNLDRTPPAAASLDVNQVINSDGSFTRGGSHNRRHFVEDPEKQAEEVRKSRELGDQLRQQMEERKLAQKRFNHRDREVERYQQQGSYPDVNSTSNENNVAALGVRQSSERQFISPSRRAPVPGQNSLDSTVQLGLYGANGASMHSRSAPNVVTGEAPPLGARAHSSVDFVSGLGEEGEGPPPTWPPPSSVQRHQQKQPQTTHNYANQAAAGWRGNPQQSSGYGQSQDSVLRDSSEDVIARNAQAKASPAWLMEDPNEEGEVAAGGGSPSGNRGGRDPSPPVGPNRSSPLRNSPNRKVLFDHERRKLEDEERQRLAILKQEELKKALEEQIRDKQKRLQAERDADAALEKEMEERRKAEAEMIAARERAEIEREREKDQNEGPSHTSVTNSTTNIHKVESVAEKRRRLREEALRRQQEESAGEHQHQHHLTPQRLTKDSSVSPMNRSPAQNSHSNIQSSPNNLQSERSISQYGSPGGMTSANEQEIMSSLETIKKELMEQRKKLIPLTPLPNIAPQTRDDGSLVTHTHQTPIKKSSMTPPPGRWGGAAQPPSSLPAGLTDHHPAREILDRNRFRLAALRNSKHHDDILKTFLMEDSSRAVRGLDRMTEFK